MDSEKYPIHKYIYEWLLDHESIVVPELGQFVAEFKGASIHPSIHSISPPNKTIIFNSEPKNDDGELAGFIAQKENISQIDAEEVIKKFVSELKISLASDQRYELAAFGVFTKNPEGIIEFQADEAINFSGDSFGFPKLFYKPVEKKEDASFFDREYDISEEKPVEQKPLVTSEVDDKVTTAGFANTNDDHIKTPFDDDDDDDLDDDFDEDRRRPAWLMPVLGVVAAGLVITAGIFVVPKLLGGSKSEETAKKDTTEVVADNKTKDNGTTTSSEVKLEDTTSTGGTSTTENSSTSSGSSESTTTANENNGSTSTQNESTTTNPASENVGNTTSGNTTNTTYRPPANAGGANSGQFKTLPYRPQTPASAAIINAPTSRFYIIVASFSTRVNAYSLYNNLKTQGYDAKIIPPVEGSTMHRVASGSYESEDEANRNVRRLASRLGNDIWVKKY